MSLSFVKSAVLSSTDGVSHNEETTIDNKETQSLRASGGGAHKPLFEQLRTNKEAEQEKNDEFQRSLRGTRALDEEDCAHLDSIERRRNEKEYAVKSGIEAEVALFRAAREDRALAQTVIEEEGEDNAAGEEANVRDSATMKVEAEPLPSKKEAKKIVPKFTIKKKRKRAPQETGPNDNNEANKNTAQGKKSSETEGNNRSNCAVTSKKSEGKKSLPKSASSDSDSDNEGGGLLGLGCYGSDSD